MGNDSFLVHVVICILQQNASDAHYDFEDIAEMKTIDEVIKANECCDHGEPDSRCEDCPYNGIGACCAERESDALHYLKEYRSDKATWEADRKWYLNWIEQYKEAREKHQQAVIELKKNPPLTWDELRTMEGKPVWVEALLYKQWAVIAYIGEEYIRFEGANLYAPECRIYMGEDNGWQAYRKERDAR